MRAVICQDCNEPLGTLNGDGVLYVQCAECRKKEVALETAKGDPEVHKLP